MDRGESAAALAMKRVQLLSRARRCDYATASSLRPPCNWREFSRKHNTFVVNELGKPRMLCHCRKIPENALSPAHTRLNCDTQVTQHYKKSVTAHQLKQ